MLIVNKERYQIVFVIGKRQVTGLDSAKYPVYTFPATELRKILNKYEAWRLCGAVNVEDNIALIFDTKETGQEI